jgi:hypothetical protein
MEQEDEKWVRKDFERVYTTLQSAGVSASEARPLLGCHDVTNRINGYLDAIGEPQKVITGLPPHRQGVLAAPIPTREHPAMPSDVKLLEGIGRPTGQP